MALKPQYLLENFECLSLRPSNAPPIVASNSASTHQQHPDCKTFRDVVHGDGRYQECGSVPRRLNTFFFTFFKIDVQVRKYFVQPKQKQGLNPKPTTAGIFLQSPRLDSFLYPAPTNSKTLPPPLPRR